MEHCTGPAQSTIWLQLRVFHRCVHRLKKLSLADLVSLSETSTGFMLVKSMDMSSHQRECGRGRGRGGSSKPGMQEAVSCVTSEPAQVAWGSFYFL